jgi:hypothetical protein
MCKMTGYIRAKEKLLDLQRKTLKQKDRLLGQKAWCKNGTDLLDKVSQSSPDLFVQRRFDFNLCDVLQCGENGVLDFGFDSHLDDASRIPREFR